MAVLAEAISVIIRADRLLAAFDGDWEAFKAIVPNATLCADGEIARVGFMSPAEVEAFCNRLESVGLVYRDSGAAIDFTVTDQQRGLMYPTPWLECGKIPWQGREDQMITACRLKGSEVKQVVMPDGWEWEGSLSQEFLFLQTGRDPGEQSN